VGVGAAANAQLDAGAVMMLLSSVTAPVLERTSTMVETANSDGGQWTADVTAAQSAFDVAESHWSLPAFAGMLGS
jgi:hypothetical protein